MVKTASLVFTTIGDPVLRGDSVENFNVFRIEYVCHVLRTAERDLGL